MDFHILFAASLVDKKASSISFFPCAILESVVSAVFLARI